MLTLVELIQELKALATGDDPHKLERINALFANQKNPAEFQVGRHYVAHMARRRGLGEARASLDPNDRKAAITTAKLVFPRGGAARALRRVLHDPDVGVRGYARRTANLLGLTGAAPPDVRFQKDKLGRFATTGWAFGIFASVRPGERSRSAPRARGCRQTGHVTCATERRRGGIARRRRARRPREVLMRPGVGAGSGYIEFEIAKAKGGKRRIAAPRKQLRTVQRTILDKILAKVPVHEACHGFVTGRSTVTNATPHVRAAMVIKLDLKDFFPSVHYRRVRGLFTFLGYSSEVAQTRFSAPRPHQCH